MESLPASAKSISETLDPKLFPEIRLIRSLYSDNVLQVERVAVTVTLIGLVALALAAAGVIGLVSFTVGQKTKEIAIRIALGAVPREVLTFILWQFSWPAAIGLFLGAAIAAATSKILRRTLFGISNLDPIAYLGAVGFLGMILVVSALLPARRALRVNVSKALHYQ